MNQISNSELWLSAVSKLETKLIGSLKIKKEKRIDWLTQLPK
jgi:hypothetical protein